MTKSNKTRLLALIPAVGFAMAAGSASAAGTSIDITDVTATITSGIVTITTLGVAVLSLVVVVKLFKWVRGAL